MTECPTPVELLLLQLDADGAGACDAASAIVRDLSPCVLQLERMRARLASLDSLQPSASEHLDEIAMAELLDATTVDEIDEITLAHVARCESCVAAVRDLSSLVRDPAIRAELDRPASRSRSAAMPANAPVKRRALRAVVGAIAAAAVLLLGIRAVASRRGTSEERAILRHATIAAAAAPRLIAPAGNVGRVDTLEWTSVPRADRYRVTVFDASGAVAWEAEVGDTNIAVPAEIAGKWTGALRWRVKARTSFDRWVDSEFGEFTGYTPPVARARPRELR